MHSGILLFRSLSELLYPYWQEASTVSPGWQPAHTWMGTFYVNAAISIGRYLSQLLTHQFSPAHLSHPRFPFNLCLGSLSIINHKSLNRIGETAQLFCVRAAWAGDTENEHFSFHWGVQGHQ